MDARTKILTTAASVFIAVLCATRLASAGDPLEACDQECFEECPYHCMGGAITECEPCDGNLSFFAMAEDRE